jgi:hypothetical protein
MFTPSVVDRVADADRGWKNDPQSRIFFKSSCFQVLDGLFLRAEGFLCNLDVLYGGLGIGKL